MKVLATWDGKAFIPSKPISALATNERVSLEVSRARSSRQHGFLFVAIEKAFDTWPEQHRFQPGDATQLRYWLEIQAGWGHTIEIPTPRALIRFLKEHWRDNMWAEELEEGFLVHVAKSIAYDKMKKGDFQTLVNRIDDVLQKELGVGLTELKISALEDAK